jgi:hypothetical protein
MSIPIWRFGGQDHPATPQLSPERAVDPRPTSLSLKETQNADVDGFSIRKA